MSSSRLVRSRPLDSLLLDDGLASGSSIPSAAVLLGQTPESAMVNEIFNNPDAWSVQFGHDGGLDSATVRHSFVSPSSAASVSHGKDSRRKSIRDVTEGSGKKKRVEQPEGLHLKRRSKMKLEAFTLKPFESRHRIIPMSSASSASSSLDSFSLPSSTPSLNSSLPTISDEDSVDSNSKPLEQPRKKWRGMKDINEDGSDALSLVALMEPSNQISPKGAERMSILWSHQNIFRALATPKGSEYDYRSDSNPNSASQPSSGVSGTSIAVTRALPLTADREDSFQPTMKPRRNVPPLTISTTMTTTTTTLTTIITVQTPEKTSPASVTVVSASATWSILELYGDSPKPSSGPKVPKTSGHLDSSFRASDIQLPPLPPKSAFASKFASQSETPRIVELPADFVIPGQSKSRTPGSRTVAHPSMRIEMVKDPGPPPTPGRDRKSGKMRPLPKVPRAHSPPPPIPSLRSSKGPPPPTVPVSAVPSLPSAASSIIPAPVASGPKLESSMSSSEPPPRGKKSALRSRMPPPPPLPLDSPLPPLPVHAKDQGAKLERVDASPDADVKLAETRKDVAAKAETEVTLVLSSAESVQPPTPPPKPEKKPDNLPVPSQDALSAPMRPSRKNVISPLPSMILQRIDAVDSITGKPAMSLSPPTSGHKPSSSESSLSVPEESSLGKSLRRSPSSPSLSSPPGPLPSLSLLAKRIPKNSTSGVRPPFDSNFQSVPVASKALSISENKNSALPASALSTVAPAPSVSGAGAAPREIMKGGSSSGQVSRLEFPTVERKYPLSSTSRQQSPAPFLRDPSRASPVHKKGSSLTAAEAKPIMKAHKKSSSTSFRPLIVDAPLPDAATLARRLAARKDNSSSSRPFPPKKDEVSAEGRPHLSSTASDSAILMRSQRDDLSSSEKPVVLRSTSDMVIPYKPPSTTGTSSKPQDLTEIVAKKISSQSSLRPSDISSSPAPSSVPRSRNGSVTVRPSDISSSPVPSSVPRSRNGSVTVRHPIVAEVPLPDPSVLAQRLRNASTRNSRPYSDVADAFTPSTASTASASSVSQPPLLQAPRPVVAAASWVPQLAAGLTEPDMPVTQIQSAAEDSVLRSSPDGARALPPRGSTIPGSEGSRHRRSRSASGARAPKDPSPTPAPPVPYLPEASSLQVPKDESTMRPPSPGILIRNKAASPIPSSRHVRFRSMDKHPLPVVPTVNTEESAATRVQPSVVEHAEETRGRQMTTNNPRSEVVSPRRSASVAPAPKQASTRKRSASVIGSSPRKLPAVPPPPIPLNSSEIFSPSEYSLSSASSRGRISPFPSRPVSRASVSAIRVGA